MSFLDDLLDGGPGYKVKLTGDGAVFCPTDDSEAVVQRFQAIAAEIIENEGDGYDLYPRPHRSSDRPGNRIDRVGVVFH